MQQRLSLEVKVGLFIISGIVLFIFCLFAIGDFGAYFQPGYALRVVFDSANGIGRGSPVEYAGVEVGKVEDVHLVYPQDGAAPQVDLIVKLPRAVKVRANDEVSISTFGLLGEKFLEIRPGRGTADILRPGAVLQGKPPVSTERIMERANDVLTQLEQTLHGVNNLVGDPEAGGVLKETLVEARDATHQWKLFGERMNLALTTMQSGEGTLGKLLFDDDLYLRVIGFVDDLQQHPWKLLVRPKDKK